MSKSKILLIFTGGTIAMILDSKTNALKPSKTPKEMLSIAPELNGVFNFEVEFLCNIDSTNIQPTHWSAIAEMISKNYDKYDGFIVTHGTDTMSYSASAVSFALGKIGKPVVFTGAQLPPDNPNTDAKNNLIHAFKVACSDIGEVVIAFGTRILRGNRSSKENETKFDAFWSPIFPLIGRIHTEIDLLGRHFTRNDKKPDLKANFNENIFIFTVYPGMKPKYFNLLLENGVDGFVLGAFGPGNIPSKTNSMVEFVERAVKKNIPVIVSSQCIGGTARMHLYETGLNALKAGGISAIDMTLESATTKLMWVLAQTKEMGEVKKMMQTNLVGELTDK